MLTYRHLVEALAVLILGMCMVTGLAHAQAVFPPLVGGVYLLKVQPDTPYDAAGIPESALTRALAAAEINTQGQLVRPDGTVIQEDELSDFVVGCLDVATDRAAQELVHEWTITAPLAGGKKRRDYKAVAFTAPGCTGEVSEPSAATAFIFFGPPNAPAYIMDAVSARVRAREQEKHLEIAAE